MATSNIGILAHVDAGKTTLTERLLHAAGVIDEIGRVDDGTTQTDSLALERQRGITIKSAVVSFVVDGVTVNLVDTPGHPDFIAEVERVLGVLDGAVLVVSAVEGVQSQTLLLFRALRRLGVPTIVFVNKIDRVGADVPTGAGGRRRPPRRQRAGDGLGAGRRHGWGRVHGARPRRSGVRRGGRSSGWPPATTRSPAATSTGRRSRRTGSAPCSPTRRRGCRIVPAYLGAALTGVGVDDLLHAIPALLPTDAGEATGPASGTVFKIERAPNGEKIAFVRMFAGSLRTRDRVQLGSDTAAVETVTALDVFDHGTTQRRPVTRAGEIAKVHGLRTARIGDRFGPLTRTAEPPAFAPPTLETAVVPRQAGQARAVFDALTELAEQDPLIDLRQDDARQELFLSLYGEVQKEIVAQTLLGDYGLEIEFRPTTPVCIERPNGVGAAVEHIRRGRSPAHPFLATVGLEISPRPPGSGVTFELAVSHKAVPIHVFDSVEQFRQLMERTVLETLGQGLHGWAVTDCRVVMTDSDYQAPPRKWPGTTLSDYRLLTPLVLMAALRRAGTTVLEPVLSFRLELPTDDLGPIMAVLGELGARPGSPETDGSVCVLEGVIRVAGLHRLQTRLPGLTRGEGVLESSFAGYRPVHGPPPARPRTDRNPLDRAAYLRGVTGHA